MTVPRWGSAGLALLTLSGFVALGLVGCGGGGGGERSTTSTDDEVPVTERGSYLNIVMPSVVKLGEPTTVRLRVLTQVGLPDYDFEGGFRVEASGPVTFPTDLMVEPTNEGYYNMPGLVFTSPGVQQVRGIVPGDTVRALANPIVVMSEPDYNIYWGDLNGHSDLSSGNRGPGVYFSYGRGIGLVDFVALTDNDHFDPYERTLDNDAFVDMQDIADDFNIPNRFVTLPAFEWSSAAHGNRLVYLADRLEEVPSSRGGVDTPEKLRAAVPRNSLIAMAHPSGSAEATPTDMSTASGDLVEVYSGLGSFEAPNGHRATSRETAGAFVQDILNKGLRVGFVASSDTRFTTPGNPQPLIAEDFRWPAGRTAVLAKELTREAVLEALRERRCYATSGPRFLLEFLVDDQQMGSEIRVTPGHRAEVYGSLGSTSKWIQVAIVGPSGPLAELTPQGDDADVVELKATTEPVNEPTWVYLRGVDEAGDMAWSSPVYLIPER